MARKEGYEYEGNARECAKVWIADSDRCWMHVWKMCREDPEMAWNIIKEIYRRNPGEVRLDRLAHGPLEDLLCENGEQVIDRVEELARRDERFAGLLARVLQRGMAPQIWSRLQAAVARHPGGKAPPCPTDNGT